MSSAVSPLLVEQRHADVVIIGVDPHKRTHTASALEPGSHRVLASMEIDAALDGYRRLLRWASSFPERRWAVENARGLGRHLTQWLLARGETVHDDPATARALLSPSDKSLPGPPTQATAAPEDHLGTERRRSHRSDVG